MTHDSKPDFTEALIKHLGFKSKLRSFLYGSPMAEAPIRDPLQCSFGKWLQQPVQDQLRPFPDFLELERVHTLIHQEANKLMDLYQRGQAERAREGFPAVEKLADRVTRLLHQLQEQTR
ncbi:CZB domain-containing protein [Hymenobacter sp. BT175]|uniref:CZB domain-containing protein n=1 Tax=Hymenobacter translucens TaxID=2886507 RepID=UPI001D0DC43D|nr:CZB domain-containing protein [Hymenobacter translucens]MCC2547016.1 CZB domain-containing protein [Hymenobacter translucens]